MHHRGRHFVGEADRNAPGIDGRLDGHPVSLKETVGRSPQAGLHRVAKARDSAAGAGYTNVDVYVRAPNLTRERMLDFARNGPLERIPTQGVIRTINIHTGDGWLTIPGDLA